MGSYIPPVAFTPVVTAGLLGESYLPIVRRWRRQLTVWWHKKRGDTEEDVPAAKQKVD